MEEISLAQVDAQSAADTPVICLPNHNSENLGYTTALNSGNDSLESPPRQLTFEDHFPQLAEDLNLHGIPPVGATEHILEEGLLGSEEECLSIFGINPLGEANAEARFDRGPFEEEADTKPPRITPRTEDDTHLEEQLANLGSDLYLEQSRDSDQGLVSKCVPVRAACRRRSTKRRDPDQELVSSHSGRARVTLKRRRSPQPETSSRAKRKRAQPPKNSAEYLEKRERNNISVRKSRDKKKQKELETQHQVEELEERNEYLEGRVLQLEQKIAFFLQRCPELESHYKALRHNKQAS